jgi:heme exporter protein A
MTGRSGGRRLRAEAGRIARLNGDAMRLRVWDLTIERGGRRLIAGLSFEARAGSALVVTGPNGAGKTSLLRALAGFLPIEAGGFALDGGDDERTIGEQAHYLGHADGVKTALTAGENLAFAAAILAGDSSRAAQLAALSALGLRHVIDFPARLLSAGQRRRVALARLLVAQRPLWLLDEPATALDAAAQSALAAVMQAHLAGGGILVATAHGALGLDGAQELRLGADAGGVRGYR